LVTNTTSDRRFLLKPSMVVDGVFLYCLARAAERYGVLVHSLYVASNHIHLVVTDTRGELSLFMAWLDRHVALCLLEHYADQYPKRTLETIWSNGSFDATLLVTHGAIIEALVYGMTNSVKDGLVPDYRQWPGLCTRPSDWLQPVRSAKRPALFFKQNNPVFAEVDYQFTIPLQFADRTPEQFVRDIEALIEEEQRAIHATRNGRPFLGVKAIVGVDPFDSPQSPRPQGTRNPTVKAATDSAAYSLAIAAVRAFREAYRVAWRAFCDGAQAIFPSGTLQMRKLYKVQCAPDDFAWCCLALAPAPA
jgi:putative transposase